MGIVSLHSHLSLLKCCVSAAVTHVLSLHEIALDYIRIGHSRCVCQVELVMTCLPVTVRTVLLVNHVFLLISMHLYYVAILPYHSRYLYVDTE